MAAISSVMKDLLERFKETQWNMLHDDDKVPDASKLNLIPKIVQSEAVPEGKIYIVNPPNNDPTEIVSVTLNLADFEISGSSDRTYDASASGEFRFEYFDENGNPVFVDGNNAGNYTNRWGFYLGTQPEDEDRELASVPEQPYSLKLLRQNGEFVLEVRQGDELKLLLKGEPMIRKLFAQLDIMLDALDNNKNE